MNSAADRNGTIRSPLTFGQLSVLRALQQLPTQRWPETYVGLPLLLPTEVEPSAVTSAVQTVAHRHESLRMHFVETPGEYVAVVVPPGPVQVETIGLAGAVGESEAVAAARARYPTPFRWASEIPWRAFLVTDSDGPRYLILLLDHMLVDGFGSETLMSELRGLLHGDDDGRQLLAQIPRQPRELAHEQRSDAWRGRRAAASRYWDRLLDELPAETFPWPAGPDDAGRIEGVLRSPRARAALAHIAHRLRVSPQSVMLALTAIAVSAACDQDHVVLTLQASNRFDPRWRDVVTSMNQATPLPVAVGAANGDFASFAQRVHWDGLNAYRHGSYHFDEMVEKVRRARGRDFEFDLYFNFMAADVVPQEEVDLTGLPDGRVEANHPHRQVGQRLDVKIRPGPDMQVEIRADPTLVSANHLSSLLHWFDSELALIATGKQVQVQDCRRRVV